MNKRGLSTSTKSNLSALWAQRSRKQAKWFKSCTACRRTTPSKPSTHFCRLTSRKHSRWSQVGRALSSSSLTLMTTLNRCWRLSQLSSNLSSSNLLKRVTSFVIGYFPNDSSYSIPRTAALSYQRATIQLHCLKNTNFVSWRSLSWQIVTSVLKDLTRSWSLLPFRMLWWALGSLTLIKYTSWPA